MCGCAPPPRRGLPSEPAKGQVSGVSTTKPSPLLRNSVKAGKAGDEVEDEPGLFEADTAERERQDANAVAEES